MRPLPLLASLMIPLGAGLATPPPSEAQLLNLLLGDPNYYGRVLTPWWGSSRNWPQESLLDRRPVIANRRDSGRSPLYLRVPEDQARSWGRFCRRYDACDRPVYFVRDHWYRNVYGPRYRNSYWRRRRDRGREWWEDVRERRDDRRDAWRDSREDLREVRRKLREDRRERLEELREARRDWLREVRGDRDRRRDD